MSYKPDGYTSVAPYLIVPDAEATLAFVRAVFGSTPLFLKRDDNGSILHAELRIDDTILMVGQFPGVPPSHVHIYLPDVDATFARARDAGGSVVQEVADKDNGDRRGGISDPNGTIWWLATMVSPRN